MQSLEGIDRARPNSVEAERAAIGTVILDNNLVFEAVTLLRPEYFFLPSHEKVFNAILELFHKGGEINSVTLSHEIEKTGELESIGGIPFLNSLCHGLPRVESIAQYATIILGKWRLREAIKDDSLSIQEAMDEEDEPEVLMDRRLQRAIELAKNPNEEGLVRMATITASIVETAKENIARGQAVTGLRIGFPDIDKMTGGFQPSHLIYLAARPSMGKTSLMMAYADNATLIDPEVVIAIFSYEMSKEELVLRTICANAKLDTQKFRSNFFSLREWEKFDEAKRSFQQRKIFIDDSYATTTSTMRAKCLQLKSQHKRLDMIMIDYVQLMPPPESKKRYDNRQHEVSTISRELKGVAKDLKVPLVALCQLSRAPELRADHRPQLADLRESGSLEQDADMVQTLFRKVVYQRQAGLPIEDEYGAELSILKARSGSTGPVPLRFEELYTRFDSLTY